MVSNLLDEYVLNVLKNSGWSDGRKQDITQWIQILTEEGYIVNEYAKSILSELGDLQAVSYTHLDVYKRQGKRMRYLYG